MSRLFFILHRVFIDLCKGLNYIAVAVIFLLSLWIFADVIGRYFFNHPIGGTTELVKGMIIIIVFLSMPYTWQQGSHIRTTVIMDRFSPKNKLWLEIFVCVIAILVFAIICIFSWHAAWRSWSMNEFDGTELRIPVFPSRFVVVIGAGLMVIQLISELLNNFKLLAKRPK
jgi:TRAP-type C4-dicarboxylate transport system permease small subunit